MLSKLFDLWVRRERKQYVVDKLQSPLTVIVKENDLDNVSNIVADWLAKHYRSYTIRHLETFGENNHIYKRVTFETASGKKHTVRFDITAAFK
ncbi:unnamed protein product [Adineta ricciae]|uniref:Uncharacterized protein n=1 Tax=Adineta ricciae TaxID=249248 RepID=A0A815D5F3_ADIRI|nr:unnamed protein product [Adineta ricciae]